MTFRFLGLCAARLALASGLLLGLGGCGGEFHLILFNNTNDQVIFRQREGDLRPIVILACTAREVTGLSTDDLSIERNGQVLHYRYPAAYTFPSEKVPSGYERRVRQMGKAYCVQLAPDNRLYLLRTKEPYTSFQHPEQPPGFPLAPR